MESLPNIESWIDHRNVNRHSRDFVRTLQECHQTLLNHQAILQHSSTLLRPSSAEATTLDTLLRPLTGTHPYETDSGEQLLRASEGQEPNSADQNETFSPAGRRERHREHATEIPQEIALCESERQVPLCSSHRE